MDDILEKAQRNKRLEIIARTRIQLEERKVIGKEKAKHYVKDLVWHKDCVECGQPLPAGMARVCSSACYIKNPLPIGDNSSKDINRAV